MPIYIGTTEITNLFRGETSSRVYRGDTLIFPVSTTPSMPASNQMFSLVRGIDGYSGDVVRVFNGITTSNFGLQGDVLDPSVDTFLSNGNGTNRVLSWFDQNGGGAWTFPNNNNAPSLITESDGTKALATTALVGSNNGVTLSGNGINAVYSAESDGYILIPPFTGYSTYLYLSGDGNSGISSSAVGSTTLFRGTQQIANTLDALSDSTLNTGYQAMNYRNVTFPSSLPFRLLRFGNGQGRNMIGRVKEVSTYTSTSVGEQDAFIQSSIDRNNL